jgi:hypothetical protein
MRLTVHVSEANQNTSEKNTKEGVVNFKQTFNTLSYSNVHPKEVNRILKSIESERLGTPTKHYLTNEKIPGISKVKKKK